MIHDGPLSDMAMDKDGVLVEWQRPGRDDCIQLLRLDGWHEVETPFGTMMVNDGWKRLGDKMI